MIATNSKGRLSPLSVRLALMYCLLSPTLLFGQSGEHKPPHVDLLVTGATIVTMDPDRHVIEKGFIAVRGDEIVAMGSDASPLFLATQRIDATGKLIIPGLINGHTHIPMVLMRGLKDDVTLD